MRLFSLAIIVPGLVQAGVLPRDTNGLSRRDDPMPELGPGLPKRRAAKFVDIKPISGIEGARRTRVIYGPFLTRGVDDKESIPGTTQSMDKMGTAYNFQLDADFPRDVTVLLATSDLLTSEFKKATLADRVYNHHNSFMVVQPKGDQLFECTNGRAAKEPPPVYQFAGTASERITFNFTSSNKMIKTGYHIPKDALMQNMVDLVNLGPRREFYTENEIEYIPGFPAGYLNTKFSFVTPDVCGGADGFSLHAPADQKKFAVSSEGLVMKESGYVVRQKAHVHDGGTDISVEVNGKKVCQSDALYGGPDNEIVDAKGIKVQTLASTTECDDVVLLKKGDTVKMTASFDFDKHSPRPMGSSHSMKTFLDEGQAEQMAIMYINFAQLRS